jgi:aryl carrier-like protein
MTLSAATQDLTEWLADDRDFRSLQGEDWLGLLDDFRDSLITSGPKLRRVIEATNNAVQPLLNQLISSNTAPDGTITYTIDSTVRADLSTRLRQLDVELAADAATIAAWLDLISTAEKVHRTIEELSFRRDTLWAIARRRGLYLGPFGVFQNVASILTDNPDAVHEELDLAAGVEHVPRPLTSQPTGQEVWQRLKLCERVLIRPPWRGDCIVWLRLAPTSLPQWEVSHGQVTFYNADVLASFIGDPESADRITTPPIEVLDPDAEPPILREGEIEWERDWHLAYARVVLPDTVVHAAELKARAMVQALKAVHHATKDTWKILNGSIKFVDGERLSPLSWGPREDVLEDYRADADTLARDIEKMPVHSQILDAASLDDLQEAIKLSTALKAAVDVNPQAVVMAAVRAIEYVNVKTTGGSRHWADFASYYFKRAQGRVKVVEFIASYTQAAVESSPGLPSGDPRINELADFRSNLKSWDGPHQMFHVRSAADHISDFRRIYADTWLERGLTELEAILASPAPMYARLELQCNWFSRQLGRVKRLRNSSIHGGPVATFAFKLGHQCLNEAMRAIMIGRDIPSHIDDYRNDHVDRYTRVRTLGEVDALFVDWK